jgi:membrane protease YdiL (CAAX protease family)
MASEATSRRDARAYDLLCCLLCISVVWTTLLLVPRLANATRWRHDGVLAAYAFATLWVAALAPRRGRALPSAPAVGTLAASFVSGLLSFGGWAALVSGVGGALGLAPPSFAPGSGAGAAAVVAVGVLSPLFEELLYRGWLLGALAERTGWWVAIVASSAVFALPHGEAWSMLTTFLLGLVLGGSRRLGVRVSSCVGAHSGLNVAFLFRDSLSQAPVWLPMLGVALWAICVRIDRQGPVSAPSGARPSR